MGTNMWTVPYLPIDPSDVGREYETDVIRINSQSGKGGIGYLLEHNFGYVLPAKMREDVGYTIKDISDKKHSELSPEEVLKAFTDEYVNINDKIKLIDYHYTRTPNINVTLTVETDGEIKDLKASGNGRFEAVSNALQSELGMVFTDLSYDEHAIERKSSSQAIAYVSVTFEDGRRVWGAGIDDDIILASIYALFSAVNRSLRA